MLTPLQRALPQFIAPGSSVLDLCCGIGNVVSLLPHSQIIGVDVFTPYLAKYKANVPRSRVVQFDLREISNANDSAFGDRSCDIVLCLDGLEHLERPDAERLIDRIERIASQRIILFTPLNLSDPDVPVLNTPHNVWGIDGGDDWQVHKSAFAPAWFEQRGYVSYQLCVARNVYDQSLYAEMLYVKDLS